ncbi:MAG: undecaprenyl/decaprenyl-phosphate alpha-N-acetylglucosaminyl 1-phosphate transferase [Verrucomicrobiales bacterium]|nr:undecaprenyl/decaprenyl-phosphate alpha-N-acetylglucosaminyl 1-phosphate transferase [Verrucomicrobiales bacterium]
MTHDAESYLVPCALLGSLLSLAIGGAIVHRHAGLFSFLSSRKSQFHHAPESKGIPRLGGLCLVASFLAAGLLALWLHEFKPMASREFWVILGSSLLIFLVGIVDDIRPLGAKKKLLAQIGVSCLVFYGGLQINTLKNPFTQEGLELGTLALPITVLWLVAITNLINLIDGMDGLAGGIGVFLMALLAWVSMTTANGFYTLVCVGTLGGLLGFLRYNFPPARLYLGDGGAYFLGFLIGLLSIQTSNKGTVIAGLAAPAIALALPIIDTTLAILRRGFKGLPLFRPDLDHIHHRLMRKGFSRTRAVLVLYAFSVVALSFAIGVFLFSGQHMPIFAGMAAMALIALLSHWGLIPKLRSGFALAQSYWRLRSHSRYALSLSQWLQLEAERCRSVDCLWKEYEFVTRKLQFCEVHLRLRGEQRTWRLTQGTELPLRRSHHFPGEREMSLEFFSRPDAMTLHQFEHVSELAAEAWLQAVARWEQAKQKKAAFTSEAADPTRPSPPTSPVGQMVQVGT